MKICYIFPSALPSKNASSLQTVKMSDALSNEHDLKIFLPDTGKKNVSVKKFYNLKNKLNIVRLKKFKKFPVGINYYLFSLYSVLKSFKFKPDFYITRMFIASVILTFFKKKHILEIHNDMHIEGRITKFIFTHLNFFNSKYIVKIVTTTKSLKNYYSKKYLISKNKIRVLPNSSDFSRDKISKKKYIKNIGYFGSIYMSRGLDKIIFLANNFKDLNFFIYGGEKKEVLDLKKKFKQKNLFFHQYVDQYNIEKKMKSMDILLLPYSNKITVAGDVGNMFDYTSPLKMFDYLASGKIIIASNIKVLREILKDEYNCFFVKNYINHNAWKIRLKEVLSNPQKSKIVSLNALNSSKKFTTKIRAEKIVSFFEN